jgi:hypothetical protein
LTEVNGLSAVGPRERAEQALAASGSDPDRTLSFTRPDVSRPSTSQQQVVLSGPPTPFSDEEKKDSSDSPPRASSPPARGKKKKKKDRSETNVLDFVKQRATERDRLEKQAEALAEFKLREKIYHPSQVDLQEALLSLPALLGDDERFPPPLVIINNESYWYNQRKLLGGRNHSLRIVVPEKLGTQWKATTMAMKRDEDFELVPAPHYLGLFPSQTKAYRAAEEACKNRDANPAETVGEKEPIRQDPSKILATHFNVKIVSEAFRNLSHWERVRLVYVRSEPHRCWPCLTNRPPPLPSSPPQVRGAAGPLPHPRRQVRPRAPPQLRDPGPRREQPPAEPAPGQPAVRAHARPAHPLPA